MPAVSPVTVVYRCMRGDGEDLLLPARSQADAPPVVASTLSGGRTLQHGGSFRGRFSDDPALRFKQKAMHAIAFGSQYATPFLHCTKSLAVAAQKLRAARERGAYLVKIDLVGLSGSQPELRRGGAPCGSQPAPDHPVVVDMSSQRAQQAGE